MLCILNKKCLLEELEFDSRNLFQHVKNSWQEQNYRKNYKNRKWINSKYSTITQMQRALYGTAADPMRTYDTLHLHFPLSTVARGSVPPISLSTQMHNKEIPRFSQF